MTRALLIAALLSLAAPASATGRRDDCGNCWERSWQFFPCRVTDAGITWSPFGERVRVCVHDFETGDEWPWTKARPRLQADAEIDALTAQVCPAWRPRPETVGR